MSVSDLHFIHLETAGRILIYLSIGRLLNRGMMSICETLQEKEMYEEDMIDRSEICTFYVIELM